MGIYRRSLAILATLAGCFFAPGLGAGALSTAASPSPGSDPVVAEWPHWPYQVSCGGAPFNPVSVFSGPAGAETGTLPSELALRQTLADPTFAWLGLSKTGWRLASESAAGAVFISGRLTEGLESVRLEPAEGSWKLAGNGTCTLRSALQGLPVVDWTLTSEQPALSENTRRLWITISGGPCNSGMPFHPRKPVFRQLGKKLLMTIVINPPSPGPQTCQGILQPPFTVTLPGKLGDRKLFNGGIYPPPSAAETRLLGYSLRSARLRQ
jgi:hypothetical protein